MRHKAPYRRALAESWLCYGLIFVIAVTIPAQIATGAPQSNSLTNADVIREVQLGYTEQEIISNIKTHSSSFKLDDKAKSQLLGAGVSKAILTAMFEAWVGGGKPVPTPQDVTPPAVTAPAQQPQAAPLPDFQCPGPALTMQPLGPPVVPSLAPLNQIRDGVPTVPYGIYQASLSDTGNQVVGAHTVEVRYLNILRYDFTIGANTTFANGPSIPSVLALGVSSFPSQNIPGGSGAAKAATPTPATSDQTAAFYGVWKQARQCFVNLQGFTSALDTAINAAAEGTQTTLGQITATLNDNSSKTVSDFMTLRQIARSGSTFSSFREFPWPTQYIDGLSAAVTQFQTEYGTLSTDAGYSEWISDAGNKAAFDLITTTATALQQHLNSLSISSDSATKLKAAQDSVNQWLAHFEKIGSTPESGFIPRYDASCDAWFGKSKSTAVSLATRDLLNPSAAAETATLVTVVCNPPITISTGLGISFLGSKTPAFVPAVKLGADGKPQVDANGNAVIVDTLGYSFESKVRPVYVLQTNAAIHEWNNGFGLHGSVGADVGTANDTTTVGFVAGPSVSFFRRTFFVTPSYELGQRSDFAPGFNVGDARGNLTAVPTKTYWRSGFVLNLTFAIPQ